MSVESDPMNSIIEQFIHLCLCPKNRGRICFPAFSCGCLHIHLTQFLIIAERGCGPGEGHSAVPQDVDALRDFVINLASRTKLVNATLDSIEPNRIF